ncbi:hypothetical protein NPS70_07555 [Streptomyces sp. C10-9-1]|uniref:hypothetical protein n=1 Tax=Streptomyces sp. C10-9-1 TaxID=1859285 RepID=UPI002111B675|nr:hypothetical protein [Streptomyces sp. C10-9-1]MCQ6553052.1 hypothetical protein [Streptomyces sp. C10-9-1]
MRLRNALALPSACAVAAIAATVLPAAPAAADDDRPAPRAGVGDQGAARPADQQPTCGRDGDPEFPIRARIRGGPDTVRAGSGFSRWRLEMTNTTPEQCHHLHPVVVLAGSAGPLRPDGVAVEFRDADAGRWRPVALERTEEEELVGAFDDGFRGFVVPAGRTVAVEVRFSLAATTAPGDVTVSAAVVQRMGDDGDWVGESGDYRLAVTPADPAPSAPATGPAEPPAGRTESPGADPAPRPVRSPDARPPVPFAPGELAATGPGPAARALAAVAVTAAGGGAVLLLLSRRLRSQRRR